MKLFGISLAILVLFQIGLIHTQNTTCGLNETWYDSSKNSIGCTNFCANKCVQKLCRRNCEEGCFCRPGWLKDSKREKCVDDKFCPLCKIL